MKNLFKKMLIVATLLAINSANLFAQEIVTVTNEKGGKLVKTISKQLKVSKSAITIEKLTHLSINGILWGNDLVELSKAAPSLEYLEIVENKIWDHFKGVINMPIMSNLKELRLPSNVEEISIKSSLPKLEYLEISSYHTAIKDQQQFIPYLYLRSYKDKAIDYKTATRISSSSPIVTGGDRIGVYLTGANDKNDYFMNANAVYDLAQKETKLLKWQNHFTPEVLLEVDDIYHYEFGSRFKYDNIFLFKNIGDGTFIVPIGVKSLPAECFTGSLYNKIIINADVPSIPEGCFSNCKNLKSVELNGNIKTIGRNAFKGCGLSEITLPETINEIDIEAFEGSEIKRVSLLSTTLPETTRADRYSESQIPKYIIFDISKEAYISLPNDSYWKNYKFEIRGEKKRVDIVVEKPNEIFSKVAIADLPIIDSMSIRGVLYDTDLSILEKCVSLKYLNLSNAYIMESPRTVEERNAKNAEIGAIFALIGAVAESEYNRGQISVVDNVIAQSLADATSSLLDIKEASKESIVPTSAFSGMKELKEVRLPMTASAIRGSAFAGCSNLEKVDMPPYATSIGSSAFANCSSLVEIKLPSSVTSIGSKAFLNCTSLKVLNMPKSLNKLGDAAFSSCSSLKEIDLSNCQLKGSIDMNIFGSSYHGDHYTGHIILPNEIDHITNSFHPRYSQTITFNHKLKEIKKGSFKGGTLYFNGATPPILRDCSISNCTIYVPKGSSTAYYMEYGASNKYIEQ